MCIYFKCKGTEWDSLVMVWATLLLLTVIYLAILAAKVLIPPHNTNFSRRAFSFSAPTIWNKLHFHKFN